MKKLIQKIIWDRTNPTIFNQTWYVFSSIKIFIDSSLKKYRIINSKKLNVLDFWCWNQPYKYFFHNDNYNWCDIWESPEKNENMTVIIEWDALLYENEKFDVLLCTEVLEHLKNPEFYSLEFNRVLKKNWILILTVPQIWDYHPYPNHYFSYTPDWIKLFFWNKSKNIEFYSDTSPFQTWIMLSMMFLKTRIPYIRVIYVVLINFIFLLFPKYREYNNYSSHIFCLMQK